MHVIGFLDTLLVGVLVHENRYSSSWSIKSILRWCSTVNKILHLHRIRCCTYLIPHALARFLRSNFLLNYCHNFCFCLNYWLHGSWLLFSWLFKPKPKSNFFTQQCQRTFLMKIVLTEIRKAGTTLTKTVIALSSQKHLIFFNKSITPPNKIGVVVYHMTFSLNTKRRSKFLKTRLRYYPNNDTSFNAKRNLGTLNQHKNHLKKRPAVHNTVKLF